MSSVGDFFVTLGVDAGGGSRTLGDFIKQIGTLKLTTLTAVGALAGVGNLFMKSVVEANNAAVALRNFNAETGLSIDKLQDWQSVARMSGVSADMVADSIAGLRANLAGMSLTGQGLTPYKILGIDPRGDTWTVLKRWWKRAQDKNVDRGVFSWAAAQAGLGGLMPLFDLSETEFNKRAKAGRPGKLSAAEEAAALERVKAAAELGSAWTGFKNVIAVAATLALVKFLETLERVMMTMNTPLKKDGIGNVLGVLFGPPGQEAGDVIAGRGSKGGKTALGGAIMGAALLGAGFDWPVILGGAALGAAMAGLNQYAVPGMSKIPAGAFSAGQTVENMNFIFHGYTDAEVPKKAADAVRAEIKRSGGAAASGTVKAG